MINQTTAAAVLVALARCEKTGSGDFSLVGHLGYKINIVADNVGTTSTATTVVELGAKGIAAPEKSLNSSEVMFCSQNTPQEDTCMLVSNARLLGTTPDVRIWFAMPKVTFTDASSLDDVLKSDSRPADCKFEAKGF